MPFSFSLKSALNATNNPTTDGFFRWGSLSGTTFTLFNNYGFIGSIFGGDQVQAWNSTGDLYPHVGFENLSGNAHIEPQPFPNFGIYCHPGSLGACIRATMPFASAVTSVVKVQRASTNSGNLKINFRILKNDIIIHTQDIDPTDGVVNLSIPMTVVGGDIIDYVVRNGGDGFDSDDTALEVTFEFNYSKVPNPTVTSGNLDCQSLEIEGTTKFVGSDAVANVYASDGLTLLGSSAITVSGYDGIFTVTPLNLSSYGGQNIILRLEELGVLPSDDIVLSVGNAGCEEIETLASPTVVAQDFCIKKCSYQKTIMGTSDLPDGSFIALYRYPLNPLGGNEVIGTGFVSGGIWSISSESISSEKYIAIGVRQDGLTGGAVAIDAVQECDKPCVLVGTFNGLASGIDNGIIALYEDGVTLPIATGVILNGVWSIKANISPTINDYYLKAIKLI